MSLPICLHFLGLERGGTRMMTYTILICATIKGPCTWMYIHICIWTHQPHVTCNYGSTAISALTVSVSSHMQLEMAKVVVLSWRVHHGGFLHTDQWAQPQIPDSVGPEWGLEFCVFNKLSADAEVAGLRTTWQTYRHGLFWFWLLVTHFLLL